MEDTNSLIKNIAVDIIASTTIVALLNQLNTYIIIKNYNKNFYSQENLTISSVLALVGISSYFIRKYK
uniref:Uncharacterized protein n=1 Tax=viral metagenome TaxID=1070528 RepID=A0A6C0KXV9_9ZZZZ